MASLLIAKTTNFTIRQKENGVIFAQCNVTKKFVKTAVALVELHEETSLNKTNNNKITVKNVLIDNFILILCLFICTLSIGIISFNWVYSDVETALVCSIMFGCTFLFPYLLAKNITTDKNIKQPIN